MTFATFAKKVNALLEECAEKGINPNIIPVDFIIDNGKGVNYYVNEGTTFGYPHLAEIDDVMSVTMWLTENKF